MLYNYTVEIGYNDGQMSDLLWSIQKIGAIRDTAHTNIIFYKMILNTWFILIQIYPKSIFSPVHMKYFVTTVNF